MVAFPSILDGLARTMSTKKGRSNNGRNDAGREAADEIAKDAKKKAMMLKSSSGNISSNKSSKIASVCSKGGQKGVNQDRALVWQEFGCQEDMTFCGIFDGHGPWGHVVAKRVRNSVPSSLLCNWQETLALTSSSLCPDLETAQLDGDFCLFETWKQSYLKTYAAIDQELKLNPTIDSFRSGATALTIVMQGEHLVIANAGDSRAVLATTSEVDGSLVAVQLTIDFKPNLPQETERIIQAQGRVFCLEDERGVYRVWTPNRDSPGLAISRAFGDYCLKDFGLISVPDVTHKRVTSRDLFVILATDGVWDVISNQEAVEIIGSAPERGKSAKRLVERAAGAWKRKKRGIAMDDISAICLFFHPQQMTNPFMLSKRAANSKAC